MLEGSRYVGQDAPCIDEELPLTPHCSVEDLLCWANSVLGLELKSLVQFQNGALFCLIVDAFHNCAVDLTKVILLGHKKKELQQNYSCLASALSYLQAGQILHTTALPPSTSKQLDLLTWLHRHFGGHLPASPARIAERRRLLCIDGSISGAAFPYAENQGDTANLKGSPKDEPCATPTSQSQSRIPGAAPYTDSPHDYSRLRQGIAEDRSPLLARLPQWSPIASGAHSARHEGMHALHEIHTGRTSCLASGDSETDSTTTEVSSRRPALTPRWNASPRVGTSPAVTPRQGRSSGSSRRGTPRGHTRASSALEGGALGPPMPKPLTPSRTKKLRASDRIVEAAEEAARQAVSVALQSMPRLRRMLRDVGCAPRDGYQHMSKLKNHRDATKTILSHTWDLLHDVLQLALLHGGLVGRTRSRHVETLMKELTAAEGIFADICNEVEKAEKFFPVPETAQAWLDATAAAAADRGETDTRQHDAVLRSVSQAQAYMGSIFSQLGPVTRWSDSPADAHAIRQHVISSANWPAPVSLHSGSDADDDTSSMGGWSDAASVYSDISQLCPCMDSNKRQGRAKWRDRGLALSAALSSASHGDCRVVPASKEHKETCESLSGLDEVDGGSGRLMALANAIVTVRTGHPGRSPEEQVSAAVPPAALTGAATQLSLSGLPGKKSNGHIPVPFPEGEGCCDLASSSSFLEDVPVDSFPQRQSLPRDADFQLIVDVTQVPKHRNAFVQPDEVPGLGDVISPVYRMAECFAEMERGKGPGQQPEWEGCPLVAESTEVPSESLLDSTANASETTSTAPVRTSMELLTSQAFIPVHMDLTSPVDEFLGAEFWESMVTKDLLHSPTLLQPSPAKPSLFQHQAGDGKEALLWDEGTSGDPAPPMMLASISELLLTHEFGNGSIMEDTDTAQDWLHSSSLDCTSVKLGFRATALTNASVLTSHPLSDEDLCSPAPTMPSTNTGSVHLTPLSIQASAKTPGSPEIDALLSTPGTRSTAMECSPEHRTMTTPRNHPNHIAEPLLVTCAVHSPMSMTNSPAQPPASLLTRGVLSPGTGTWQAQEASVMTSSSAVLPLHMSPMHELAPEGPENVDRGAHHNVEHTAVQAFDSDEALSSHPSPSGSDEASSRKQHAMLSSITAQPSLRADEEGSQAAHTTVPSPDRSLQLVPRLALPVRAPAGDAHPHDQAGDHRLDYPRTTGVAALSALRNARTQSSMSLASCTPEPNAKDAANEGPKLDSPQPQQSHVDETACSPPSLSAGSGSSDQGLGVATCIVVPPQEVVEHSEAMQMLTSLDPAAAKESPEEGVRVMENSSTCMEKRVEAGVSVTTQAAAATEHQGVGHEDDEGEVPWLQPGEGIGTGVTQEGVGSPTQKHVVGFPLFVSEPTGVTQSPDADTQWSTAKGGCDEQERTPKTDSEKSSPCRQPCLPLTDDPDGVGPAQNPHLVSSNEPAADANAPGDAGPLTLPEKATGPAGIAEVADPVPDTQQDPPTRAFLPDTYRCISAKLEDGAAGTSDLNSELTLSSPAGGVEEGSTGNQCTPGKLSLDEAGTHVNASSAPPSPASAMAKGGASALPPVGRPRPGAGPWSSPISKVAGDSPASTPRSRAGVSPRPLTRPEKLSPGASDQVKLTVNSVGNQLAIKLAALSSALPELSRTSAPPSPMGHPLTAKLQAPSVGRASPAASPKGTEARQAPSPRELPEHSQVAVGDSRCDVSSDVIPLSPPRRAGNVPRQPASSPSRRPTPNRRPDAQPVSPAMPVEAAEDLPDDRKSQRAEAMERLFAKSSSAEFAAKSEQVPRSRAVDIKSQPAVATHPAATAGAASLLKDDKGKDAAAELPSGGKVDDGHSAISVTSSGPISFSGPISIILSSLSDVQAAAQPGSQPAMQSMGPSAASGSAVQKVDQTCQTTPRDDDLVSLQGLISRANSSVQIEQRCADTLAEAAAPASAVAGEEATCNASQKVLSVVDTTTSSAPRGPSAAATLPATLVVPLLPMPGATPEDAAPKPRRLSIFRRKGRGDQGSADAGAQGAGQRRMLFRRRAASDTAETTAEPSPRPDGCSDADALQAMRKTSSFFRWGKKQPTQSSDAEAAALEPLATPRRISGLIRALRRPDGAALSGSSTPRRTSFLASACAAGMPTDETLDVGGAPLVTPRGSVLARVFGGRQVPMAVARNGPEVSRAASTVSSAPGDGASASQEVRKTDARLPAMALSSTASRASQAVMEIVPLEEHPGASANNCCRRSDPWAGQADLPRSPHHPSVRKSAPSNLLTPRADVLAIPAAPALLHPMTSRPRSGASEERRRSRHFLDASEAEYNEQALDIGDRYKGMAVGDIKHGDGAYYFANGDAYEGEFLNDSMCGHGSYIFASDGRYEGQWEDAVYCGSGMETFSQGSTYHGGYFDGARHGWGVCRYYNGDYYEGEWRAGLRHGRGMQRCTDKSTYVGDYRRGKRDGFGAYSFPNGDRYLGQYRADLPHGHGVYYFATGQIYEGEWDNGKKSGWCVYTVETGVQWAGEWRAGKPKWVAPLEVDEDGDPHDGRGEAVAQAMDAARLARAAGLRCASFACEYAKEDGKLQAELSAAVQAARGAAAAARGARSRANRLIASKEQLQIMEGQHEG